MREYFLACEREALAPSRHAPQSVDSLVETFVKDPRALLAVLGTYAEQIVALQATVEIQRPAVEFVEHVADATNTQGFAEVAKALGTGRQRLIEWLLARGVLYRVGPSVVPRQEHIEAGRFIVREGTHERGSGRRHLHATTRVTGKGLLWIQRLWTGGSSLAAVGGAR